MDGNAEALRSMMTIHRGAQRTAARNQHARNRTPHALHACDFGGVGVCVMMMLLMLHGGVLRFARTTRLSTTPRREATTRRSPTVHGYATVTFNGRRAVPTG